jgi:hypothetical protein
VGNAKRVSRQLKKIPTVGIQPGTFVSANTDGTVQIDFGQGAVTCQSAGFFQPLPGDFVRCIKVNGITMMLGPAIPRSSIGKVTATGTPVITVTTSIGSKQLPFLSSYTPTIGDTVDIDWASGGIVLGKTSAVPASSYAAITPTAATYSADFRAGDSGTWSVTSSNYFTADSWCTSTGHDRGAWFYGTAIADTIPDAAVINSVQAYMDEFYNEFPAQLALIGLHALTSKSGAPTITSPVSIPAGSGFKVLPTSFGDALKTGVSKGIGTGSAGSSGYHKFRGVASDAESGLLRIQWTV